MADNGGHEIKGEDIPPPWVGPHPKDTKFSFEEMEHILRRFLRNYPEHLFTGASGDPGPRFIVALRTAVAILEEARPTQE